MAGSDTYDNIERIDYGFSVCYLPPKVYNLLTRYGVDISGLNKNNVSKIIENAWIIDVFNYMMFLPQFAHSGLLNTLGFSKSNIYRFYNDVDMVGNKEIYKDTYDGFDMNSLFSVDKIPVVGSVFNEKDKILFLYSDIRELETMEYVYFDLFKLIFHKLDKMGKEWYRTRIFDKFLEFIVPRK